MSLSDLDAKVVPRLAAGLRSLLDGVSARVARARRPARARPGALLRRLDDRFAGSGPLALLRDVPQLGVLLVSAVFLTGAGVALARSSPEPVAGRGSVEDTRSLSLGPPAGADVDEHFAAAGERLTALSDASPDDELVALVSLREQLTPEQAVALVGAAGLQVRRAYVRAPVGGTAEVLPVEVVGDVAGRLGALFSETAAQRAEEQRTLLELAASIPDGAGATDAIFRQQYVADARSRGEEAAAYRTACACVLALVVEGPARELAGLPTMPPVRGVEPARRGADLTALDVAPLPPEVTGTRPAPPVLGAG